MPFLLEAILLEVSQPEYSWPESKPTWNKCTKCEPILEQCTGDTPTWEWDICLITFNATNGWNLLTLLLHDITLTLAIVFPNFPRFITGSQMNSWSGMSASSKVNVCQMSAQKLRLKKALGPNEHWGTEEFEINEHWGAHSGKYGNCHMFIMKSMIHLYWLLITSNEIFCDLSVGWVSRVFHNVLHHYIYTTSLRSVYITTSRSLHLINPMYSMHITYFVCVYTHIHRYMIIHISWHIFDTFPVIFEKTPTEVSYMMV